MPTYEYACRSCGTHVEVYQRFSDPPLTECGVCGGPLRKVFHPAGILFKGSGFYATDSRRGRASDRTSTSEATSKEGAGKAEGTTKTEGSGKADRGTPGKGSSKESAASSTKESA